MVSVHSLDEGLSRKLVALRKIADESENEAEGTAAILAIQRLMISNDLNESEILFEERREEVVSLDIGEIMVAVPQWKRLLHVVVAKNFRCGSIVSIARGRWTYERDKVRFQFLGKGNDPILAKESYETAVEVIESLWDKRREAMKSLYDIRFTSTDKKDYCMGFVEGLGVAYKDQVAKTELGLTLVQPIEVSEALSNMRQMEPFTIDKSAGICGNVGFQDGHNYGKGNVLPEEV